VDATLDALRAGGHERVALGIDVRGKAYLEAAGDIVRSIGNRGDVDLSVLFLEAPDEMLARRYSATRRPHPLAGEGSGIRDVLSGIDLERELLSELRGVASMIIDSEGLSVHDLRREVVKFYSDEAGGGHQTIVRVVSFGFKYGSPRDADVILDVRFLPNPYFVEELRPHSGKDAPVADFVLSNPDAKGFVERAMDLLSYCVPRYQAEGKSYVTLAIGCTGGRHRSVALTEHMAAGLSQVLGFPVDAVHRDIRQAEHLSPAEESPTSGRKKKEKSE